MPAAGDMGIAVKESSSCNKILVGVSLDVGASMELLSWAITVVARPEDVVVAMHVLATTKEKEGERKHSRRKTGMRRAMNLVISMLGEFSDLCNSKQVKIEARVKQHSSVKKGLIREADLLRADYLIVGGPRSPSQETSLGIPLYCFKHAPEGCMVIVTSRRGPSPHSLDFDVNSVISANTGLEKYGSRVESVESFDRSGFGLEESSINTSPRTVLDGLEEEEQKATLVIRECLSPCSSVSSKSRKSTKHRRSRSIIKFLFPTFLSSFHGRRKGRDELLPNAEENQISWRCFSFEEISCATNNFHPDNFVGRGGYAEVYKGNLDGALTIAVKRLSNVSVGDEHKEKEFLTELGIVGHVSHPNTVEFLGCCIENGFHLVFNYSPNGTLDSALHEGSCGVLEWHVRYKIAGGVARGLQYLHNGCRRRIIHRDIKASNVLLGPDFEPQISDFGLAKWLPGQWTHHSMIPIEGTFGYLAPEYFMHGIIDEKTDIFAFGVLLLEIVTGRRPVDPSMQSLLLWAKPFMESGNITELVDPKLEGTYDMDRLQRLVAIASQCTRISSIQRPSMNEVLQLLTDGHHLEVSESLMIPSERVVYEIDDYASDGDYTITSFFECDEGMEMGNWETLLK